MGHKKGVFRSTRTCYNRDQSLYWILGKVPNERKRPKILNLLLEKYCNLSIYDIDVKRRYTRDDEDIQFINNYGYDLIDSPENPDGTSTDHECFIICDDLFDIALATDHNSDILLKVINTDVSFPLINYNG